MTNDDYHGYTSELTDAQLLALDQLMSQTHRLYGLLDEFTGHPMLTEQQRRLVESMFEAANELDNRTHDRLEDAKRRRGIDTDENVGDHIDIRRDD